MSAAYRVRVYCHISFAGGACPDDPSHPFILPESFSSIRAANDAGGDFVGGLSQDDIEWEVLDPSDEAVC